MHFSLRIVTLLPLSGISTFNGLSFPDNDGLPLGYITDQQFAVSGWNFNKDGVPPALMTNLPYDQQVSVFSLWCFARSPLLYGGDLIVPDPVSLKIITNEDMLNIHAYSFNLSTVLLGSAIRDIAFRTTRARRMVRPNDERSGQHTNPSPVYRGFTLHFQSYLDKHNLYKY